MGLMSSTNADGASSVKSASKGAGERKCRFVGRHGVPSDSDVEVQQVRSELQHSIRRIGVRYGD